MLMLISLIGAGSASAENFDIYFDNTSSGWSTPYIHYWGGTSQSTWPGVAMINVSGNIWKYTVADGTTGLLFNAGDGDATKTSDFAAVSGHLYTTAGDQGVYTGDPGPDVPTPDPVPGMKIYFDNTTSSWASPYIHYWGGTSQSTWPGVAMQLLADQIWVADVAAGTTGVLFNAGDGDATKTSDFVAVDGHIYNTSGDQGEYNPGPKAPSIAISPKGGKVKGSSTIKVTISGSLTSASARFNGHNINLTAGENSLAVSDYLADEQTATLSVEAVNEVGTSSAEATFTRRDAAIPVGEVKNLITDYYKVNPNGQVGTRKSIAVTAGQKNGALSHWDASDLIAQGVARDVCMAFRGVHERPVVDSYAMYAAYDATNLYIGVQMVYTVWDKYGEGYQAGESKPYNMDGKLMIALDLDPEKSCDGTLTNGASVWFDKPYTTFDNGMDCLWLGSTKPGVGTPGLFMPNDAGKFDYNNPASCKPSRVVYGYDDGLLPSIDAIWGQGSFGYDPAALEGNEGFEDLRAQVSAMGGNDSAHTFYEFAFPLADLGITEDYITSQGIGVMFVDLYGSSAHAALPYDPSTFDNVNEPYSQDSSTSAEKEDQDCLTYSMARVGRLADSGVENITIEAAEAAGDVLPVYYNLSGMRVANPTSGLYIVVRGNKATKEYIR